MTFNISYILATRNRLPFLKITLEKLINELLADEEIIVINGNSNDGTSSYLKQLYIDKKIHCYINEPDQNQAHAWNKGMLLANGKFIKKIMDDDIFCFASIRKCKNWMIEHPEINICISNTLQTNLQYSEQINKASRLSYFLQWQKDETSCFTFSDVYILIRKEALSFTGLYDTQFRMIDWEFSLRCSFLKAKIGYYTGYNSLTVDTPGNITSLSTRRVLKYEAMIAKVKYGYPGDDAEISIWSNLKIALGLKLQWVQKNASFKNNNNSSALHEYTDLESIYNKLYNILEHENQKTDFDFIC
ncbi:glycosyltransferase family 2 protein [Mucilaginibacter arboris]|uniref:glycosyltransferase family 2 protein n=1 Tax=Mucilaginibacter arboris TaxID=2682090 RepID=UPI0012F8A153|nr:glycosyltransferase [Mucilaginibacter arboris]